MLSHESLKSMSAVVRRDAVKALSAVNANTELARMLLPLRAVVDAHVIAPAAARTAGAGMNLEQ